MRLQTLAIDSHPCLSFAPKCCRRPHAFHHRPRSRHSLPILARAGPQNRPHTEAQPATPSLTAVPSSPFSHIPVKLDTTVTLTMAAIAGLSYYLWCQFHRGKQREWPKPNGNGLWDAALEGANTSSQEGREYRMALARTRQAVAVHKAIGFLHSNNIARAMVELRRALHENSVCRAPVLSSQLGKDQIEGLYRMHLQQTSPPADFAVLLQLRTMLDLDFDVAEKLERDVMEQGSAYSI